MPTVSQSRNRREDRPRSAVRDAGSCRAFDRLYGGEERGTVVEAYLSCGSACGRGHDYGEHDGLIRNCADDDCQGNGAEGFGNGGGRW